MEILLDRCLKAPRPTVLVIGDAICDVYLRGTVRRISPEAPVPVFESSTRQQVLGGAANVAANLQMLGCHVRLLSVVGADAAGRRLRELLQAQGIDSSGVLEDPSRPTTEKTRLVAHQQHVLRLDQEGLIPLDADIAAQALQHGADLLAGVDGLVCSDYHKGFCTPALLAPLFAMARAKGIPIIVDPKVRDFTLYRGATVLTPNLLEVERASGYAVTDSNTLRQAVDVLLDQSQAQALLLTRGKDGMSLFHPPDEPVHIPAQAREVFDVTGAGDTVVATLSMGLLSGLSLVDAARLANAAAGVVVGKVGTSAITPEELRAALRSEGIGSDHKIMTTETLAMLLQERRERGDTIVFTNGCFDLLHVGHIQLMQRARVLGDCLVVALNDDASVRLLKGEPRPVLPQHERARILAALQCVDYVTIFSEPTPLGLIEKLRPDILVKGGDYSPAAVVGGDVVERYGGRVCILPSVPGVSTTKILDAIITRSG
jgi:D-beta-D-heptose 7-phosphate kinase/D-beta-D-heptose 1-phosphate adenosyltransferase